MMPLHQLLEACLDTGAVGAFVEPERVQRFALQWLEPARRRGRVALEALAEEGVRVGEGAAEAAPSPALVAESGRLARRARFPRRPVTDHGILLERLNL